MFYYVHVTFLRGSECRRGRKTKKKKGKGALSSETDTQSQC